MIDLKYLLNFNDFKDLDDAALVDTAEHSLLAEYNENDRVIAEQMADYTLYLLEGDIEVQSTGGVHQAYSAQTERAHSPLFYSDQSGHYARCLTDCKFLQVERAVLKKYGIKNKRSQDELDYAAFDTLPAGDSSLALVDEITSLFKSKSVTLPSLPEIALYINAALDKEDMSAKRLAKIIQMDPVIAARLVQVANSALYGSSEKNDSIQHAVTKIGLQGVRAIVMGVVLRDLFMPNTEIVIRSMARFYEHSIRVGVICYEFARRIKGFSPEKAFLAGILHDIGVVPILVVADTHTELAYKASNLEAALSQLKSYIGGMVLQQWEFDPEYIEIAKHAYDWKRVVDKPDYCDLVQVALLHSHLLAGEKISGPELSELPAFKRLGLDQHNPIDNLATLKDLGQRVTELVRMICK